MPDFDSLASPEKHQVNGHDSIFGTHRVYAVVVAAHELAANAVRHGAGRGRLRLRADGAFLYCQASDDGPARL